MRYLFLISLIGLLFTACSDDDVDQDAVDQEKIENYLEENDLTASKHSSGLHYRVTQQGSGNTVPPNANISVNYKGTLLNGNVFDSGTLTNQPLQGLILAWQIGIPLLQKGSKAVFYCPSTLAYGNRAVGSIPANSVLIFEIEVTDFN